jgi:glycosyltransferase involved in cell wall biosynthesis
MKILYFINGMHRGGKERRLVELIKELRRNDKAEVALALMSRDMSYPEILTLGFGVHYLIRRTRWDPGIILKFHKLCADVHPDIVHTWDPMTTMLAGPATKFRRIPLVAGMITNAKNYQSLTLQARAQFWLGGKMADVIVANSLAGLKAYHPPEKKSVCIYNGFDLCRLNRIPSPAAAREYLGIKTPHVVGMAGEFADRKDFDTYILAAQEVLQTRNDVTFLAIGGGKNEERCKALVEEKYRAMIRFLGWRSDVDSILSILDLSVLATNADVHGEGISNSILESMALGKPVIATESGGTGEIIVHGVTGFIVANKNPEKLAGRIEELLDDPARMKEMGEKSHQRVRDLFTIEKMTEQYVALYHALLEGKRFSPRELPMSSLQKGQAAV